MSEIKGYRKQVEVLSDDVIEILDNLNIAVCVDDGEGYEIWINRAAEELYEIDRNDIIGYDMKALEEAEVYVPSLTRQIIEKKIPISIIHENRVGKQVVTSGIPLFDENNRLRRVITSCVDITRLLELEQELQKAREVINKITDYNMLGGQNFIVSSVEMQEVMELVEKVASIDASILITGESGTGKSDIAKLIHETGSRKELPFVKINCGAIPENLLESEFFGYEPGAFTGSSRNGKKGLFELANHGTVFLDEVGELPMPLQVKLLQVLQDKEFHRVGGEKLIKVDVRIISATNRDLHKMVLNGSFREDLYYRLNVIPIHVPPLRKRPEDLVNLIKLFLARSNERFGENKVITMAAMVLLLEYPWPGNVRELENVIERIVITTKQNAITPNSLPSYFVKSDSQKGNDDFKVSMTLKEGVELAEKQILQDAAKVYKNTRDVAEALDVNQSTIVRKFEKYKIKIDK